MIREFIDFTCEYDPGFQKKIQGATMEEIERLERASERKLPGAYREFLTRMGRSMGGIGFSNVDFSIGRILEMHEEKDYEFPRRYLLIAEQVDDPYCHFFLDLETLSNSDCEVVSFDSELSAEQVTAEAVQQIYPSLRDMLYFRAFAAKRLAVLPCKSFATISVPKAEAKKFDLSGELDVIERCALRLGFRKVPNPGRQYRLFDRSDAAILASHYRGLGVDFAARDKDELMRIREILCDNTVLHN